MTQVTVGENEGIESALRRFKRQVSKAGIFADLKRLRHHETPVEKYKRKAQQRRRRRCASASAQFLQRESVETPISAFFMATNDGEGLRRGAL